MGRETLGEGKDRTELSQDMNGLRCWKRSASAFEQSAKRYTFYVFHGQKVNAAFRILSKIV